MKEKTLRELPTMKGLLAANIVVVILIALV